MAGQADAEKQKIEITREMIRAGVRALDQFPKLDWVNGDVNDEEVARDVFAAMWRASLAKRRSALQ